MLSRSGVRLGTALAISLILFSSFGTAFAQVPAFGQEWPIPSPPSGYSSWGGVAMKYGYTATGPITVGGLPFFTKVLNRLNQEQDPFVFNDQPFSLQVTVPANVILAFIMGIIEYHPPSYQISSLLPGSSGVYAGTAGSTTNVGPFSRGNDDPEGKYAWRIGMMVLVCSVGCGWVWSQSIQYYNFKQTACGPGTVWDPNTNGCNSSCPANQHWDTTLNACAPNVVTCSLPCTHLDPSTNTCVSSCANGQQCENNQCLTPCPVGTQRNPLTNSCNCPSGQQWNSDKNSCETTVDYMPWVYMGLIAAIIAIGIVAVFLLTRKKPTPSAGYKPYYPTAPTAPMAPTLKPGAPQAAKPAHRPMVIARREEEKK